MFFHQRSSYPILVWMNRCNIQKLTLLIQITSQLQRNKRHLVRPWLIQLLILFNLIVNSVIQRVVLQKGHQNHLSLRDMHQKHLLTMYLVQIQSSKNWSTMAKVGSNYSVIWMSHWFHLIVKVLIKSSQNSWDMQCVMTLTIGILSCYLCYMICTNNLQMTVQINPIQRFLL